MRPLCLLAAASLALAACVPVPVATYPESRPAPEPPPPERPPRGEPRLRLDPPFLDFGAVDVTDGATREVRLRNDGPGSVWVSGVRAEGDAFDLGRDECGRAQLRAGDSCTVRVRFAPRDDRRYAGSLRIDASDARGPLAVELAGRGLSAPAARASARPDRVDFGRVEAGGGARQRLEVRNEGRSDLRLGRAFCEGRGFDVEDDGCSGRTLGPGRSCTLTVAFRAEGRGDADGALVVPFDERGGGALSVSLRGQSDRRAPPEIGVEPRELDFGRARPREGRTLDLTVRNEGRSPVRLRDVQIEGRSFSLDADRCSRETLGPGRSCGIRVAFSPEGEGSQAGRVFVVTDGPDERRVAVTLRGEGEDRRRPEARVRPDRLDFGALRRGERRSLDVEVRNEGRGDLLVRGADVQGRGFREGRDDCSGRPLGPGRTCRVAVEFAPEGEGTSRGALRLETDDPRTPRLEVPLEGRGEAPPPPPTAGALAVRPERLDFGEVRPGERKTLDVDVRNEGRGALLVRRADVQGRGFREGRDDCSGRPLGPGRTCRVAVEFAPDGPGSSRGALRLETDDPRTPRLEVALEGRGEAPPPPPPPAAGGLALRPERLDFGEVRPGERKSLDVEVRNEGRGALLVHGTEVKGKGFREARDDCSGRPLGPGRTCRVAVEFAPDGPGSSRGALRLESTDPQRPRLEVPLEGRGQTPPPRPGPPPPRTDNGPPSPPPPPPSGGGACRAVRLDPLGRDQARLAVDLGLDRGECATYAVSVSAGALSVRAPEGYRLQVDGVEEFSLGRGKGKWDRTRSGGGQRLELRRPAEVRLTVTREGGGRSRDTLLLEWSERAED